MCLNHPSVDSQDLGLVVTDAFHAVAAAAGAPAGAPHWVGQFFALQQQQFLQIQQQIQQNNQQIQQQFQQIQQHVQHTNARHDNSAAHQAQDALTALLITNPAGNALVPPAQFPQTLGALNALTGARLAALLTAYGKPVPATLVGKRSALRHYIGVRPVVLAAGF